MLTFLDDEARHKQFAACSRKYARIKGDTSWEYALGAMIEFTVPDVRRPQGRDVSLYELKKAWSHIRCRVDFFNTFVDVSKLFGRIAKCPYKLCERPSAATDAVMVFFQSAFGECFFPECFFPEHTSSVFSLTRAQSYLLLPCAMRVDASVPFSLARKILEQGYIGDMGTRSGYFMGKPASQPL